MGEKDGPRIVWAPLPVISWLLPFVGHVGITDTHGTVYDFQGSRNVHTGALMCGPPALEVKVSRAWPEVRIEAWDSALRDANAGFAQRDHNLVLQNCHHHVAAVVCNANVRVTAWGVFRAIILHGSYVSGPDSRPSFAARGRVLGPFALIIIVTAAAAALYLYHFQ